MSEIDFIDVPFYENPDPRCACVLLLDTSGSMYGEPIQRLNEGIKLLKDSLMENPLSRRRVEIAVVTFDSSVTVVQDFVTADDFNPPSLTAHGLTHLGEGMMKALDLVESRKEVYKRNGIEYYRPWIFLITDGEPQGESPAQVQEVTLRIKDAEAKKKVAVFGVGVENANLEKLQSILVREPRKLNGLDFISLFQWLSASMNSVSQSNPGDQLALPQPSGWTSI